MRVRHTARAVAGFTLVEIMIAVLVLAVGVVGGVSMQLAALRAR
ncbi:MAG TPA: prepilin-type N-terminal cleavage/methylation domain-containing protein, partial [Duganella sp.]